MTTKTLSQNAAELLLRGKFTLACPACGESTWTKANPARQTKKLGLLTVTCKTCANAANSAYTKKRYATDEAFREAHKAYYQERRANDPAFRESRNSCSLQWAKDNPGKANAKVAKRRSKKLQATPEWSDLQAIQAFYEACPEGFHVDHIVPLQGKLVSGLHVPNNLQYLTATDNLSKGNKHELR